MKHRIDWLKVLLLIMIVIGVCFRFINIDRKIYWHDEAYTSMRAAGFTRQEIDTELFQNRFLSPSDLQKFQQIKPNSTTADTVHSLAIEDPQHPPLYYVMAREWMGRFGSSIAASRSLPALLSLLALPCMYGLAIELFGSPLVALVATALVSLSPFDILFAQTARQYSLLTVLVTGSSWMLLRAIRRSTWQGWGSYAVAVALGLYTHPFFTLTVIGHGVYVLLLSLSQSFVQRSVAVPSAQPVSDTHSISNSGQHLFRSFAWKISWRLGLNFLLSIAAALILYSPWLLVLSSNLQRADATTDWTRTKVGFLYLVKLWTLSFTSLFSDLTFDAADLLTYVCRIPFVLLIVAAFYAVIRHTSRSTWLFIVTLVWIPFLLLAVPDVVMGGKRSAVSRYLISCYPGIQLAVAYLLTIGLQTGKRLWQWILVGVLTCSLSSTLISMQAETWWNKDVSYFNAEVLRLINTEVRSARASNQPFVLVSDIGDDYTNTGDLLSLSYGLDPSVRLFLVSKSPDLSPLLNEPTVWIFRLSNGLKAAIEQQGWQLETISNPGRLTAVQKL